MVQQVRAPKRRSPAQLPIERYVDYFVSSMLAEGCSPSHASSAAIR